MGTKEEKLGEVYENSKILVSFLAENILSSFDFVSLTSKSIQEKKKKKKSISN